MLFKNEDGTFNLNNALENLIEKYGQTVTEEKPKKKRKAEDEEEAADGKEHEDGDEEGEKKKKPKAPPKTSIVAEERNRKAAEALHEMASGYFKNGDPRKGGVFSKAAKALRECETYVSNKKEAMALKGIGKGIAGYIEELLETGSIQKLEEIRAGTA
jgi:hypothetical protein